jgi:dihydropyrimidine dehydrogenase (NAD+) subunit PreT
LELEDKKKYLTETEAPFSPLTAIEEASRCLLCYDAPCSQGCPAGTNPGKFIRSIRFRNFKGAAETIREANILGGVCARICPYDKTCEEACSRTEIDKPIQIGKLQRFATDFEKAVGMKILEKTETVKEKVAIIGSGPAGLAAAASLALKGYQVSVFEEKAVPGGVLSYGIVPSRLPQEVVDQEIQYVKDLGAAFVLNCKVGKDITLEELKEKGFEAFFLAVGLQKSKGIDIPGIELDGVMYALDYLAEAKPNKGNFDAGKNIIIIGGGDVAMDCATTAKLLGDRATIVYRRRLQDMPANKREIAHVQSIGVDLNTTFVPAEIIGKDGKVVAFKAVGKDEESVLQLKADKVVFAIGQEVEDIDFVSEIKVNDKKLVMIEEATCRTNIENVFAAGDVTNGGKTVVQAVAEGKAGAEGIDAYLTSLRELGAAGKEAASEKEGVK